MFDRLHTMRRARAFRWGLVAALWLIPAVIRPGAQTDEGVARISAPELDAELSGTIQISGTAIDPGFVQYNLDFALDPPAGDDAWKPIQPPIAQQVQDGVLGSWDTTQTADGVYQIRLRIVRQDGTAIDDQVRVRVFNATPVPTPTPTEPATATAPPPTATAGPSPTSLIWQPPTRTPRPTLTPGGPTQTPVPFSVSGSPFTPDRLGEAAGRGMLIGLAAFVGLALYLIARLALRGELRGGWHVVRTEYLHPLWNSLRRRGKRTSDG